VPTDDPTTNRRGAAARESTGRDEAAPESPAGPTDTQAQREPPATGTGGGVIDRLAGSVPWPLAIVAGGGAYLVGYVCTALLFFVGPASFGSIDGLAERLKIVGFVFDNQHFVDVVVTNGDGAVIQRENIVLAGGTSSLPPAVYFAVPVVVLLAVGFAFARSQYGREEYLISGPTGVGMALGYAGVGYLAAFVFVRGDRFGNTAAVDGGGILLMGLVYAAVLGTVGCLGALAWDHHAAG
jgi:hypothetical protein